MNMPENADEALDTLNDMDSCLDDRFDFALSSYIHQKRIDYRTLLEVSKLLFNALSDYASAEEKENAKQAFVLLLSKK